MTITNHKASLQRLNVRFIGASNQPIVITTWMYYLLGREKFRAFFRDWKRFEEQSSTHLDHAKIKRVRLIIYFLYFTLRIGFYLLIGLASFTTMNIKSENEFIAKHYPHFIELYSVDLWLRCSQLITVFIALTVVQLIEITPVLVYYHISKMINAMEVELKSVMPRQFNVDERIIKYKSIQLIWSRFENLRVLLTRADSLFGPILVLYHGVTFFVLCSTVFSMLVMVRKPDEREYFSVYIMSLLYTPARLLFSFVMISKVHEAADSLKSTVACLSTRVERPVSVSSSSRDCVIQCFLNRLQYTKLTASPSDLYKIKPSILLTLLGLIVSYTIILLESN